MENRAIAPETQEIQGTLDCSNGLAIPIYDQAIHNTGSNASFGVALTVLEDMGLQLYDNFKPFVVYQGQIVSTYSPTDEQGNILMQTSPTFFPATYWGQDTSEATLSPTLPQYLFGIPPGGEIEFYFLNGTEVYKFLNPSSTTYATNDLVVLNDGSEIGLYCTLQLTDYPIPFDVASQQLSNEIQGYQTEIDELTQQNQQLSQLLPLQEELEEAGYNINELYSIIESINDAGVQLNLSTDMFMLQDADFGATDTYGDGCSAYTNSPSWCGGYDDSDFNSMEMCTACGGGITPSELIDNLNAIITNLNQEIQTLEQANVALDYFTNESEEVSEEVVTIQDAITAEPVNITQSNVVASPASNLRNLALVGLGGAVLLSLIKRK